VNRWTERRVGHGGFEVKQSAMRMPNGVRVRDGLITGTLILFLGRLVISFVRSGPVLFADEIGYLANARVLAGGVAGQLEQAAFYRGGYSLLIAPLLKLTSNPEVVYHLALVLNAALAASVFPLLYVLLTRFVGVAPRIAIWAAFAGAVYPAITVLSQITMSENALFPLVCAWLIAFGGVITSRTLRSGLLWAAAVGASAAALWMVHNRMIAVVVVTAAVVAWFGMRRRLHPAAALTVLLVLGAGMWATQLLDAFLLDHNYGSRTNDEMADRVSALLHGHAPLTVAANLLGHTWYLIASSFGLAAVVLSRAVTIARGGLAGEPKQTAPSLSPVIPILLIVTAMLLLVSAAAFPVRVRPDMLIYGRYVEVVTPPLIALGLATLACHEMSSRVPRALMTFALVTAAMVLIRASADDPGLALRWNVAGLPFVAADVGPLVLTGAALVAGAGAWLLGRVALDRARLLGPVALALFLPITLYGIWNPVLDWQRQTYPSGWKSPEPVAAANSIDVAGYDLDHTTPFGQYGLQWFLPGTYLRLFHGGREPPPSRYVLSANSWSRDYPDGSSTPLWSDVGRDQVLWDLRDLQEERASNVGLVVESSRSVVAIRGR
jgi:hypothetical protein